MNKFTIRLTKKYTPEEFSFDGFENTFMVLETDATNEHYQGLIITDQKAITIRKKFEKLCPDATGNKAISIKDCNKDKKYNGDTSRYITYLCKGTKEVPPVVVHNSMKVEGIETQWKSYWEENEVLKAKTKSERKAQSSMIERIFEEYPVVLNNNSNDYTLVVTSIVRYGGKHFKPWSYQQIANMALAYLHHYSDERQEMTIEIVVADIMKRKY